jgi:hypothetical protein
MAKRTRKASKRAKRETSGTEVPPGATRKAMDRPQEPGGGPTGSAAGPHHAADDIGTETETFGATDITRTLASPPIEEEDWLEKGPPFSGRSGGAVGGTPAQGRSSEGSPHQRLSSLEDQAATTQSPSPRTAPEGRRSELNMIRLTGFEAIEYAEKQNLKLNKHPDPITGPRVGLNIGEAQAIADDDPDLIWLDVAKENYYEDPPTSYEPDR